MDILLVSAFREHHPEVRPGQYLQSNGESLKRALEECGHTVMPFDYRHRADLNRGSGTWEHRMRKWTRRLRRLGMPLGLGHLYFQVPGIKNMNAELLRLEADGSFDLILLMKAELVAPRTLAQLSRETPTWYFFMDPMQKAKLHRIREYGRAATRVSATRSNIVDFLINAGIEASLLMEGVDPSIFHPDPEESPRYDIVFVGTVNPWRRKYLEFCEAAGMHVETWGRDSEHGFISGADLGRIYRQARLVLDFQNTGTNTGFSQRVLEVMGSGACLLSEHTPDLEKLFDMDKEVVWFRTPEELVQQIKRLLEDEELRLSISRQAAARIGAAYTWEAVARAICTEVSEL